MEEEITYPRYDDDGNLLEGPPVVPTEEEKVVEEDGGILNPTQTSQSSVAQTILFPQTMQMQREIFVLKNGYITPQDAENFCEQAQRLPRLRITDVTHFTEMTQEQRFEWQTVLDIEYIANLIMQYFGTKQHGDHGDHTLAELFAKVPFHYSLNSDEDRVEYVHGVQGFSIQLRAYPPYQSHFGDDS